jgi:hypothetical protein
MLFDQAIESDAPVARTSPEKEYLSGAPAMPLVGGYQSVANHVQHVVSSSGPWLADLMLLDEKISGSIRTIKHGVLAQGMQITATVSLDPGESVEDITQEEIDTAFRIEDHCERSRRNFSGSWYELLNRLMDSMAYRTMLAETVKRVEDSGPDEGLYVLDRIPVKDAGTWRFVRDPYGNVRGIEADTVSPDGLASASKIFSRDKFVILPWLPRGSNPWGQGLLSEAYSPWNFKIQLHPRFWQYIDQFAQPILHATPGPDAKNRRLKDKDGKPYGDEISPAYALGVELIDAWRQRSKVFATDYGSAFELKTPSGNGAVFQLALDIMDRAIVYAMHATTLSLGMQGKRSNDTSSATGQDLLGLAISYGKWALKDALERDLWYVHVLQNWGREMADRFTPAVSFGMTNPEDFSRNSNAIYRLYSVGAITPEERPDALRFLGLQFSRRRKSAPAANLSEQPQPNGRPVNIKRKAA